MAGTLAPAERHTASYSQLVMPEAAWCLEQPSPRIISIEAEHAGQPAGLALMELRDDGTSAQLLSVCTRADYRRHGIGRMMMSQAASQLRQKGCAALVAEFVADEGEDGGTAGFLEACGFVPFQPGVHIRSGPIAPLQQEGWWQLQLPGTFTVDAWRNLTASERMQLAQLQDAEYPEILSPFIDEDGIDRDRSLLLRYKGEPVGWTLLEHMDESTLLFKTMYVFKRHQRLARGVALFAEALRRALAEGVYRNAIFFVEHENEPMRAFAHKYFQSPLIRKEVLWRSHMPL